MIYWMYFLPLWLSGLITIVVFCAFGVTGLALTRRWAPSRHHAIVSYNDIVGYFFGAITVSLWHHARPAHGRRLVDSHRNSGKSDNEASTVAAFYLDVSQYPEPHRGRLQNDLRKYTREVIDVAWPEQQKGIVPRGNVANVARIANDLAAFEPLQKSKRSYTRRPITDSVNSRSDGGPGYWG